MTVAHVFILQLATVARVSGRLSSKVANCSFQNLTMLNFQCSRRHFPSNRQAVTFVYATAALILRPTKERWFTEKHPQKDWMGWSKSQTSILYPGIEANPITCWKCVLFKKKIYNDFPRCKYKSIKKFEFKWNLHLNLNSMDGLLFCSFGRLFILGEG